MTEHHTTAVEHSLLPDDYLVPTKIVGFNSCDKKHIYENATKYLICGQAAYLKDVNKDCIGEDDFPHCVLKMLPCTLFEKKDPIIVSVKVVQGTAKIGTPLCMPCRGFVCIGRIVEIERFFECVDCATEGQSVQITVTSETGGQPRLRQRNAYAQELLVSCKTNEISTPFAVRIQHSSDGQVPNGSSMNDID